MDALQEPSRKSGNSKEKSMGLPLPASSNSEAIASPKHDKEKKIRLTAEQLEAIYESIRVVKEGVDEKFKMLDERDNSLQGLLEELRAQIAGGKVSSSQLSLNNTRKFMDEIRKLQEQMATENGSIRLRLDNLEKAHSQIPSRELLDRKLDKLEFANFVSMLNEDTINPMQKQIDKCKKDIQCIEVSRPFPPLRFSFRSCNRFHLCSRSSRTSRWRSKHSRPPWKPSRARRRSTH